MLPGLPWAPLILLKALGGGVPEPPEALLGLPGPTDTILELPFVLMRN